MRKFVVVFVFSVAAVSAQTRKLTIDDLLSGGDQAFSRRGNDISSHDQRFNVLVDQGQIVVKSNDGTEPRVLTSSEEPKSELALSSDEKSVAYVSQGQVWTVPVRGGEPVKLTDDPAGPGDPRGATDHHPQWNPNGRWILYESGQKGFNELYVVSTDAKVRNRLATTEVYHGKDVIAKSAADRGDAVSSDRFDPRPHWSPDGNRISYTERSRKFFSGKLKVLPFDQVSGKAIGEGNDIYVAKNDSGGAWAINTAAWSPDGRTLAVILQESHWDKIWTIPAEGGKPTQITSGEGEDEEPLFSPDGKWILFESNRGVAEERHLWVVPAKGGSPHRITNLTGLESSPRWSEDSQKVRFQWRSTLGDSATYIADTSRIGEPRLEGNIKPSPYASLGIVPQVVHYKSKDGLTIAGILYRPVGFKSGGRYPALILAHGGPEGQVTLAASPWSLFLAGQEYVVLEPNFRGSTGYGERFRNANVEDSGGGEIDDIAASVKYLVDSGLADPKRVGISGGSHGGTVVANAVAKLPDTFAVGIEKFGVVDRALFLRYTNRNSAIRWETKMGGPPDLKPAVYRKADVLLEVDRIKIPLLILHGEQDPQVPPQESQEFVAALKKAGKNFAYKTYPGEGHGFQKREHRRDAYEQELTFLNKYLQPNLVQQASQRQP